MLGSVRETAVSAVGGVADPMSPQAPRTTPLTVISPIRPGWTPFARLVMQVLPHLQGGPRVLEELRFIQSARWAVLAGLPGPDGRRVGTGYDYLLFESNFNGSLDAYLDTFADVLHERMRLLWNSSYGFPNFPEDTRRRLLVSRLRKRFPARAFADYVRGASLPIQHFYSAYPDASTGDVLAGLQAQAALAGLRLLALGGASPERFTEAFTRALVELQGQPLLGEQPARAHGDQRGDMHAFTALSPITAGREQALYDVLTGIGEPSPFAALAGVHFARWLILDAVADQPGQQRDGWPQAYLLTSTTSDGTAPPYRHLHRLLGEHRDLVWGHCDGYPTDPTPEQFAGYLARCRVPTGRFYTAYPDAGVDDVRTGLDSHRRLVDFARRGAVATPSQRLDDFRRTFCADPSRAAESGAS